MKKISRWVLQIGLVFTALLAFGVTAQAQLLSSQPNGFPDNDGSSGKMLDAISGLDTLGEPGPDGTVLNVHIRIAKGDPTEELRVEIFDADLYSDELDGASGFFDFPSIQLDPQVVNDNTIFELYPDVNIAGNTTTGLIHSMVADPSMDNVWTNFFANDPVNFPSGAMPLNPADAAACQPAGEYCYFHLVARWYDNISMMPVAMPTTLGGNALNAFKPATNGEPFLAAGTSIGIIGFNAANPSISVPNNLNYDGVIALKALVRTTDLCALDIYDGDTDFCGGSPDCLLAGSEEEDDDPNTPATNIGFVPGNPLPAGAFYPFSVSSSARPEGVNAGAPPDDDPISPSPFSISPPVFYTVSGPLSANPAEGTYSVVNSNPSGNLEYELFRVARTDAGCPQTITPYDPDGAYDPGAPMDPLDPPTGQAPVADPDALVTGIGLGFHDIIFTGMDANNTNFLNVNVDVFVAEPFDFGDAPDSYMTLAASGGPKHSIDARLFMGDDADPIDAETDGTPSTGANGDDVELTDDEDGVAGFDSLDSGMGGEPYPVEVVVKNALDPGNSANLVGWIDFNGNGSFETGESASTMVNPGDLTATLNFGVTYDVKAGNTYARFRLTTDAIDGRDPGGEASDGEVEDYPLTIDSFMDPMSCRVTGGALGIDDFANGNRYHAAGQAGANTALPPQPAGEWTHTQQNGPAGSFTFHGGTASAPQGTEIDDIRCSDPGGCAPSGNPPSPAKQIDFDGIGTFKNIGKGSKAPDFVQAGANVTAEGNGNKTFDGTYHWFEVNIDDLGEPGNGNPDGFDPALCPPSGFGEKGALALADCSCADFYRITIYDGVDASSVVKNPDGSIDPSQLNRTDIIYQVWGYIDGGNLQIHSLTGFDTNN